MKTNVSLNLFNTGQRWHQLILPPISAASEPARSHLGCKIWIQPHDVSSDLFLLLHPSRISLNSGEVQTCQNIEVRLKERWIFFIFSASCGEVWLNRISTWVVLWRWNLVLILLSSPYQWSCTRSSFLHCLSSFPLLLVSFCSVLWRPLWGLMWVKGLSQIKVCVLGGGSSLRDKAVRMRLNLL